MATATGTVAKRTAMVEAPVCEMCSGTGLKMTREPGRGRVAMRCDCQARRVAGYTLRNAQVPRRYEHCTLEDYETSFRGADPSLAPALLTAQRFVEDFPVHTEGKGLLLVGSIGVGKTHLAVGVLEALLRNKGAAGLFCDYRDLLKQVQHSYNPQVAATEMDVLRPVFEAEVLVLDELGASKPTDWVWDTVAHILNTRYNDKRTTIFTTNYANLPAGTQSGAEANSQLKRVVREETLGDRIGDRMRSRLMEMCVTVEMHGQDWRQSTKLASFGERY